MRNFKVTLDDWALPVRISAYTLPFGSVFIIQILCFWYRKEKEI